MFFVIFFVIASVVLFAVESSSGQRGQDLTENFVNARYDVKHLVDAGKPVDLSKYVLNGYEKALLEWYVNRLQWEKANPTSKKTADEEVDKKIQEAREQRKKDFEEHERKIIDANAKKNPAAQNMKDGVLIPDTSETVPTDAFKKLITKTYGLEPGSCKWYNDCMSSGSTLDEREAASQIPDEYSGNKGSTITCGGGQGLQGNGRSYEWSEKSEWVPGAYGPVKKSLGYSLDTVKKGFGPGQAWCELACGATPDCDGTNKNTNSGSYGGVKCKSCVSNDENIKRKYKSLKSETSGRIYPVSS
ncbi:MAG: hypothetical protein HY753_05710 [Nitrospirae bacterium]|nr:hypothetical protein [Nitrospirota bacterium]